MIRKVVPLGLAGFLSLALALPAAAQPSGQQSQPDLQKQIEALKRGQMEIRKDLEEIKQLLRTSNAAARRVPAQPNVRNMVFELGLNPVKGDPSAKLTLIEFTDYQCGFCSRHNRQTAPQIEKEYVETGKLRYASMDLPLEMHKLAFKAAEASHCAEEQGKFWEMHDRLFANQQALEPWNGHAEALGLDVAQFEECMSVNKYAQAIRADMAEARKAGASGTPSFVLGLTDPDDPAKVKGLTFIRGAVAFSRFKTEIDKALGQEE
ncbi:MAG: thioredoxin domain-containing protein [Acidobacteriota bacterium]